MRSFDYAPDYETIGEDVATLPPGTPLGPWPTRSKAAGRRVSKFRHRHSGLARKQERACAGPSTVGSNPQNEHVQQQDSSNVKGLPGNKSGPPAKR